MRAKIIGTGWAILSVAIFSGWFVVTLLGFHHKLQVWDIIALRFGVSALLLTPILLFGSLKVTLRRWTQGIPLAFLWGVPFIFCLGTGIQWTSTILASAITPAMMPVFAGLLGWRVLGTKPRFWPFIGYALIVVGLTILTTVYGMKNGWPDLAGIAFLLLASMMWATFTLRVRQTGFSSIQATALICFWSAVFFFPIYFATGITSFSSISTTELIYQSVYQGILMSVVAVFSFNRAVVILGPKAAASIIALVPVSVTLLSTAVFGEFPSPGTLLADFIIAVGVITAAKQESAPGDSNDPAQTN